MAVTSTPLGDKMIIKVEDGVSSTGKAKIKNKTFANVVSTITDDDFYAIGNEIAGLQSKTLSQIVRNKTTVVANA